MPIYCDEAGYTGYDLLPQEQPYFVYSSLNIAEEDATSFREHLKKKYFLQGEMKGANIIKHPKGQAAIRDLYETYCSRTKMVYHHKRYALACKYFEYVFEPVVSAYSTAIYRINFHRFISHLVYIAYGVKEVNAEAIFRKFQDLLKGSDIEGLFNLLHDQAGDNELAALLARFTMLHRNTILKEITTGDKMDYWILDLAQSAFHSLLCLWTNELGELDVICDESKPLKEAEQRIDFFRELHRPVVKHNPFGKGDIPICFSLNSPMQFSRSKSSAGLQLTDIFASSFYWALTHPKESLSAYILEQVSGTMAMDNNFCIAPEFDEYLNMNSHQFQFGVMALRRLTQFSEISTAHAGAMFKDFLFQGARIANKIS